MYLNFGVKFVGVVRNVICLTSFVCFMAGNTGNSTGPHTHIELFAIHTSFEEAVSYFQQGADFSFGTGWSTPAACSAIACQLRPELYF